MTMQEAYKALDTQISDDAQKTLGASMGYGSVLDFTIVTALREATNGFINHSSEARNPNPETLGSDFICFQPDGKVEIINDIEKLITLMNDYIQHNEKSSQTTYLPLNPAWGIIKDGDGKFIQDNGNLIDHDSERGEKNRELELGEKVILKS